MGRICGRVVDYSDQRNGDDGRMMTNELEITGYFGDLYFKLGDS